MYFFLPRLQANLLKLSFFLFHLSVIIKVFLFLWHSQSPYHFQMDNFPTILSA
jgi:hypothetical protein